MLYSSTAGERAAGRPSVCGYGLLGADYRGYFTPGDTRELADLLDRLERNEGGLLDDLRRRCAELRPLFEPARERESGRALLAELVQGGQHSLDIGY
jgi:hypothetical protein